MALEQKIALKLAQKLVMTPSLQQAIRLLQMTRTELEAVVSQELVENPVLEEPELDGGEEPTSEVRDNDHRSEANSLETIDIEQFFGDLDQWETSEYSRSETFDAGEPPPLENTLSAPLDLQGHLLWQLRMSTASPQIRVAAEFIIGNVDSDGFLRATREEIEQGLVQELSGSDVPMVVGKALDLVRSFEPVGIAQISLPDSLRYQLQIDPQRIDNVCYLILDRWELFAQRRFDALIKELNIDLGTFREATARIASLDTRPGRQFGSERTQYVDPDVFVIKLGNEYVVQVNDSGMPRLRINRTYRHMLSAGGAGGGRNESDAKNYIREKMKSALWLIRSLDQRQRTIYKVASSIVSQQLSFLEKGVEAIQPMILRDVAEDIGMHESTVSRVVSNKYIHTPQGIFPFKFFFHSGIEMEKGGGISSLTVKQKIKAMVAGESSSQPLSDSEIVKRLKRDGIQIARRTIAKYRDELGILSSSERRKSF